MMLTITPLQHTPGAEFTGIDLSQPIDAATKDILSQTLM
jgi:hypothetical protein